MDLYLMQHGDSKTQEQDPSRPLTDVGQIDVERVARRARSMGLSIDTIYHSGVLRATQSAELLAQAIHREANVREREGLKPLDPVEPVAAWLLGQAHAAGSLALVGHMPFMDRLASRLAAGDEGSQVVAFRTGGLVKLVPKAKGNGFAVAWIIWPETA